MYNKEEITEKLKSLLKKSDQISDSPPESEIEEKQLDQMFTNINKEIDKIEKILPREEFQEIIDKHYSI